MPTPTKSNNEEPFDVALSYAGEDREFVEAVADILKKAGIKVFYDKDDDTAIDLWGKDLGDELDRVYRLASRFVVMFISEHYARKMWTNHERKSALARAMESEQVYVLPARFDKTQLTGFRSTIAYMDLNKETPETFANKIIRKINESVSDEVTLAPLGKYLSKQGTDNDKLDLTFSDLARIKRKDLPIVAYHTSAWWANDSRNSQAKEWLDANWCVERVDLSKATVTFEKLKPGAMARVDFFNRVLTELRKVALFNTQDVSPTNRSWLTLIYVRCDMLASASFALAFDRDQVFGMEWRLYPNDTVSGQQTFNALLEHKVEIETSIGEKLDWKHEAISQQETWRIGLYCRDDTMSDEDLISWVLERANNFYEAIATRLCET